MWHSVEALFRCDVSDQEQILFERTVFLINVQESDDVDTKANRVAKSFEKEYKNDEGKDVVWRFVKVVGTQDLCEEELYDGIEVFSQLQWENDM